MKITFQPLARQDVLEQFLYLTSQGVPQAANHFIEAVQSAVEHIAEQPSIGSPRRTMDPSLKGIRRWPVRSFEMVAIYYVADSTQILIVRILHEKRNVGALLHLENMLMDGLTGPAREMTPEIWNHLRDKIQKQLEYQGPDKPS